MTCSNSPVSCCAIDDQPKFCAMARPLALNCQRSKSFLSSFVMAAGERFGVAEGDVETVEPVAHVGKPADFGR